MKRSGDGGDKEEGEEGEGEEGEVEELYHPQNSRKMSGVVSEGHLNAATTEQLINSPTAVRHTQRWLFDRHAYHNTCPLSVSRNPHFGASPPFVALVKDRVPG